MYIQLQVQIPKRRQRLLSCDCIWKPWVWKIQMSQNRTKKQNANCYYVAACVVLLLLIALPQDLVIAYNVSPAILI